MTYLQFLKALLALGPKLPQVMLLVQHIVSDVQEILSLLKGPTFAGAESVEMELNATEQATEDQVLVALAESGQHQESFGAIGDGSWLRAIFAFIKENQKLLELIIALLKG